MKNDRSFDKRLQALAASAAVTLAACGGGGGGAEPTVDPTVTPPAPRAALELATEFLASYDRSIATSVPASGAEGIAMLDKCYLHNGATSSFLATQYDKTGAEADASIYSRAAFTRSIGSKRSNVQALADRGTTNADGTFRREIDVQYDVTYADGTVDTGARQTLITGSSSGSCATPENRTETRFLGNRRMVDLQVFGRNREIVSYNLSDGSPRTPAVTRRREVRFLLRDPGNLATYMIVSGPGLKGPSGQPFSMKMLSPRILRDAPELQGKVASANYLDSDNFQLCLTPNAATEMPTADIADCVGSGATNDSIGRPIRSPFTAERIAAQDANFENDGWVAGGIYTVAVHADDGWKTINGQSGKTPIATYTTVLEALPYTLAQMQAPPAQYPTITNVSPSLAQIADAAKTTGGVAQLTWQKAEPPAGGKPQGPLAAWTYSDGVKSGSTTGFPRVHELVYFYPGPNVTTASVPVSGKDPATSAKRALSFNLYYGDRQGRVIQHTTELF